MKKQENVYIIHLMIARETFFLIFLITCIITIGTEISIFLLIFEIIIYLFINKYLIPFINKKNTKYEQQNRREFALKRAQIFLSPYKDIWGDLKLSNKNCYLHLSKNGEIIKGAEKNYPYRRFRILTSSVHSYFDLWNMFCESFSHNITYDGLIEKCQIYKVSIYEYLSNQGENKNKRASTSNTKTTNSEKYFEKLDINNCSEIELTALPGISIVTAKKVIKKREEINGFKTIEDFFKFINLKPHIIEQLTDKIYITKIKGLKNKIIRNPERSVDL